MHIILKSAPLSKYTSSSPVPLTSQNIYLFYFLSGEEKHLLTIQTTLELNIANSHITKVFVFTNIWIKPPTNVSTSIIEYIESPRLYFSQIQNLIEERELQGYIVIGTPYTTFGDNLQRFKNTPLHAEATILTVNAVIANTASPQKYNMCANIFVFHSNMNVCKERRKIFNINMTRIASCSNILYLF